MGERTISDDLLTKTGEIDGDPSSGPDGAGTPILDKSAPAAAGPLGFAEHPERYDILGELHARPLLPIQTPRSVYHLAFLTDAEEAEADRARIVALAQSRGLPPLASTVKYYQFNIGKWDLRWEQHTEFTTYTWTCAPTSDEPFPSVQPMLDGEVRFTAPGKLIAAVQMSLLNRATPFSNHSDYFDEQSLVVVKAADGNARIASDFQVDASGCTRFLIEARELDENQAGRLVQRVLEVETYRTLALLGLPVARSVGPRLGQMEKELARMTTAIAAARSHHESHALLHELGNMAAEIEAQSVNTAFRFAATRAYYDLVKSRLELIGEQDVAGYFSVSTFFNRRLVPALETCNAVESRQRQLSQHLGRATDLLRTGIQFDLEQQNRNLLRSMDRRAKLQLRLQQTVEGLSVAAISYYVVGLLTYGLKGLEQSNLLSGGLTAEMLTAFSVPVVVGGVWYLTQRVKRRMATHPDDPLDTHAD